MRRIGARQRLCSAFSADSWLLGSPKWPLRHAVVWAWGPEPAAFCGIGLRDKNWRLKLLHRGQKLEFPRISLAWTIQGTGSRSTDSHEKQCEWHSRSWAMQWVLGRRWLPPATFSFCPSPPAMFFALAPEARVLKPKGTWRMGRRNVGWDQRDNVWLLKIKASGTHFRLRVQFVTDQAHVWLERCHCLLAPYLPCGQEQWPPPPLLSFQQHYCPLQLSFIWLLQQWILSLAFFSQEGACGSRSAEFQH